MPFFSAYPAVLYGCGFLPAVFPSVVAEALIALQLSSYRNAARATGGDTAAFFSFAGVMLGFALAGGLISAGVGAWAAKWECKRRKESAGPVKDIKERPPVTWT